jgi:PAS domain S-box-containing protein
MSGRPPADDQRRETDVHLRTVIDNAPLVVWSIDKDGIFTLSEGRGLAKLGLAPGQVLGQSVYDVYKDFPELLASLRRALAGSEGVATLHVADLVFETVYQPLRDARGEITGLLGISTDVTERHRAEKERAMLQAQLLQVQKLESLGLLAGGIAHDFNNILTAILGSTSNALLRLPAEHAAAADIQNAITAARRAADLTRQMLAYSGKGQFDVRPLDLSALVSELGGLLETTVSKKVQLRDGPRQRAARGRGGCRADPAGDHEPGDQRRRSDRRRARHGGGEHRRAGPGRRRDRAAAVRRANGAGALRLRRGPRFGLRDGRGDAGEDLRPVSSRPSSRAEASAWRRCSASCTATAAP